MWTNYSIGKSDRLNFRYVQFTEDWNFHNNCTQVKPLMTTEETALSTLSFNVMEKMVLYFFSLLLSLPSNFRSEVINIEAYQGENYGEEDIFNWENGCSIGMKLCPPPPILWNCFWRMPDQTRTILARTSIATWLVYNQHNGNKMPNGIKVVCKIYYKKQRSVYTFSINTFPFLLTGCLW